MMGLVAFGGSAQHNVNGSGDSVLGLWSMCLLVFFLITRTGLNLFRFCLCYLSGFYGY
jgi:hypothetical protein